MAGFTFPLSVIFVFHSPLRSIVLYGMCICILILVTHQKNIERLLKGKESRVNLFRKKTAGR
jgi:glycerol-3-phosphate acyltransferase PlsY